MLLRKLAAALLLAVSSCSAAPAADPRGMTVLELASTAGAWSGLDPLTNASASINHDLFNAVYGRLFRRGADGRMVPELAAGSTVTPDRREVDIILRPGVVFSDGTPVDAAAVAANLTRDLAPGAGCRCRANFAAVTAVTVAGPLRVALHLREPDPILIEAFLDAAPNWIVSPTALARLGETRFAATPVGAGPFVVVTDHLNSSLVLAANRRYWRAGRPRPTTPHGRPRRSRRPPPAGAGCRAGPPSPSPPRSTPPAPDPELSRTSAARCLPRPVGPMRPSPPARRNKR